MMGVRADALLAEVSGDIGFTPKEILALGAAGVERISDLLDRVPKRYEDRRRFDVFPTQASMEAICLRGMVIDVGRRFYSRGVFEIVVQAGSEVGFGENSLTCRWFNAMYVSKMLAVGQELILYGKPKDVNGKLVMDHPEFEIIQEGSSQESVHVERIVPVYRNISGLAQRRLREIIFSLLEQVDVDSLEGVVVDETYPREDAYQEVHFPQEMEQVEAARRFFALEEFVQLQLEVGRRRRRYQEQKGRVQGVKMDLLREFYESLPFDLTDAQKRCVREIISDMRSELPMNRMLQGDVGSGKTFVALCSALLAVDSDAQVALMAPTQILAEQHYLTFKKWLDPLDIRVGLMTSGKLENGKNAQLLIGTHALLYDDEVFDNLGLVIIDEQHKFGVEQRGRLVQKGVMPDVLVMTATPIPRTLTLTVYGDLDVSIIDEYPSGRGKVITAVRTQPKVSDVTKFLKEKLEEGRQAYIVYPLVEESDHLKAEAATVEFEKWQKRFSKFEVSLIHGKMSGEEKEQVMQDFRSNHSQVLVSTSVIEVGVDVPNATVMIVYNAERFGLSQLHQLRGRIGRGKHKSYCILITNAKSSKNPEALEKLQVLADTRDGFKVSEADLRMRGPGDVLGTEQSGLAKMRFVEFLADTDLIRDARRIAQDILKRELE